MKIKRPSKNKTHKEKFIGWISTASGGLSFLGGWQVCHNLCLGIIAALSLIGITVAGMPMLFLNTYAVYFWSAAIGLLALTLILYWKHPRCMPPALLMLNIGIVIVSIPFKALQPYKMIFWFIGGIFILGSAWLFFKARMQLLAKP